MPTFYLQFGLRPIPPKTERNSWADTPGFFLDDSLHAFKPEGSRTAEPNQLIEEVIADNWIEARAQVSDVYTL